MLVIVFVTIVLSIGVKQGARFNALMVGIKLIVIAIFIVVASMNFKIENWHPFLPFGWQGVANGAP